MQNGKIEVHEVTRVEGHGNIILNVKEGKIEELRLDITESPRFFEAMLVGRNWYEATHLTCRICGICSIGHSSASINALENGLGVEPSELTMRLRRVCHAGETLQSHVLHVYFLAAPDLLGVPSVFPLVETHTDVVKRALKLKRLANDICGTLVGRHIHPCSMRIKAFPKLPSKESLAALRDRIVAAVPDLQATVDLVATLPLPAFERETEYVSLYHPGEYAMYGGQIIRSSTGPDTPLYDYLDKVQEYVVPHSLSKHVHSETGGAYMVGALARFNNNHAQLRPEALAAAETMGLRPPCYNPYMNSVAQVVECVHVALETVNELNALLDMDFVEEDGEVAVKACRCVGASEVPRGILFHEYNLDDDGYITSANLIIPTGQNLNNLEQDMHSLVPQILEQEPENIRQALEMLVRAYDPCISCATHLLEVKFV
jgi:coenzyme F420-reducing hydrogenase alpha subunit